MPAWVGNAAATDLGPINLANTITRSIIVRNEDTSCSNKDVPYIPDNAQCTGAGTYKSGVDPTLVAGCCTGLGAGTCVQQGAPPDFAAALAGCTTYSTDFGDIRGLDVPAMLGPIGQRANTACSAAGSFACCTAAGGGTCTDEALNTLCTGMGAPYVCCTGAGTGDCLNNMACTGAAAPYACCTGAGTGTCVAGSADGYATLRNLGGTTWIVSIPQPLQQQTVNNTLVKSGANPGTFSANTIVFDSATGATRTIANADCIGAGDPVACCTGAGVGACSGFAAAGCTGPGAPVACCNGVGTSTGGGLCSGAAGCTGAGTPIACCTGVGTGVTCNSKDYWIGLGVLRASVQR